MTVTRRRVRSAATLVAALAVIGLATATAADAHVTVTAPGVAVGASDAEITFRVPDESDTASTVAVRITMPLDHPIAGVLVEPKPGWTATITQKKLDTPISTDDGDITEVVSEVDWTAATGQGIKPGYFGDFTVIGGKLPVDVSSLTFSAIQRYSDGKTVRWIQRAAPGSTAEPEFPAPVLDLAASGADAPAASSDSDSSDTTGIIGIVLGALGIVLGAAALLVARRRPS